MNLSTAAIRHGLFVPDTCRRVRQTATEAFYRGGMVQRVRYGYRKLSQEEADSGEFGPRGLRMAKRPECTPVILEMRRRLMETKRPQAVADWLNAEGVEQGPYARRRLWSAAAVRDLLCDPVLHGTRRFRKTVYRRVFGTGKHRRERNAEPITKLFPELAHMSRQEQEQMLRAVGWSMDGPSGTRATTSPRRGVPKKRSLWPGQAATCGGPMHVIGNYLRCARSLAREGRRCWNRVQAPVTVTRQRAVAWLLNECERQPELRETLVSAAIAEQQQGRNRSLQSRERVRREIHDLEKQAANLARAIRHGGELQALVCQLQRVEDKLDEYRGRLETWDRDGRNSDETLSNCEMNLHLRETNRDAFQFVV
ncbi:MAG: recombinase family protein [Planctomycetes bacterium]|nr:recombinase family protein [Planctomycetota bacterium]